MGCDALTVLVAADHGHSPLAHLRSWLAASGCGSRNSQGGFGDVLLVEFYRGRPLAERMARASSLKA